MNWLSLIPGYRSLLDEVQRLTEQNAILETRVDAAENERARVWGELRIALANERQSMRAAINEHWQTKYGVTPHPDAPHIPINRPTEDGGPVRASHNYGGAVVASAQGRFRQQYAKRIEDLQRNPQTAA